MDLEKLKRKLAKHEPRSLGIKNIYSVLIPLIYVDGELSLLYETRALSLSKQPGEVSFPGGMVEKGESYLEAAIRETIEELNIYSEEIEVIKKGDYFISPYNFIINSYIGFIDRELHTIEFSRDEVDSLFTVPIEFLKNNSPAIHYAEIITSTEDGFPYELIPNGKNYKWRKGKYPIYFYQYKKNIIWGLTARLTKEFIDLL
ncbi:NUDIX hydrolase [Geotoga petraea]|jgi:8-oxo-dGTP pyrophosphatase MutT (NUDIX family)|uniref:NUDIX domain-containing protein n=1 Tax=Geotoga petraea TaxID=28234 RepID=A0A1G6N4E7_9BACT|nr:CoA pyrophosphatase [Geotoga petraea]SDC62005.1 NUDIX domain-containing protein [Geotoga petraea]